MLQEINFLLPVLLLSFLNLAVPVRLFWSTYYIKLPAGVFKQFILISSERQRAVCVDGVAEL